MEYFIDFKIKTPYKQFGGFIFGHFIEYTMASRATNSGWVDIYIWRIEMDSKNVSFGKPKSTGAVYVAPAGTAVPTDGTTALASAFKNLGYISDAGLIDSVETDTTDIKAWGGDVVLSGQTSFAETFTVNLLETNAETLKLIYGAENVTVSGDNITVNQTSSELSRCVVVFEVVLTGNRIKRICVPQAQIVDRSGEINYQDGEAIIYPAKFKAYPDTNGSYHKEYISVISAAA